MSTASIETWETALNDFDARARADALAELLSHAADLAAAEQAAVNMHCHTFYSFNAYGYSPSGLAWLAKRSGFRAVGIVDFDVLDGVDEFMEACETAGVRGSAGLETRVFIPEFSDREINSPGEPGVSYHMGIGFTSSAIPAEVASIQADMRQRAEQRNQGMVARLNAFLAPVSVDYQRDVLPLTPAGNATERHLLKAYIAAVEAAAAAPVAFWAEKLGLPVEKVAAVIYKEADFQNLARSKLMKRGGVGYVQPGPDSFPTVDEVHRFVSACGALPCATWLDGLSQAEQDEEKLLELLISKGAAALNIVPDRNWNIADPAVRQVKLQKLYEVVELAQKLDLPLNIGTEMNSPGNRLLDDFTAPELQPVKQAFIDGAHFVYGHTMLQRARGWGYQSAWAQEQLPTRRARNAFFTQVGAQVTPGKAGIAWLRGLPASADPNQVLIALKNL
jgi:hypothetical protein